jgi:hypothetical protein
MSNMEGGALIAPQTVAVQEGHLEMLKQSHIKVDNRYFAIDPNLDFESSTILCEDRVYVSDQVPNPKQPITFTIQPQFNVFRSLSESRFVFTIAVAAGGATAEATVLIPKPYWSQLLVRDFTVNINNVAVNDQHSRTASYAGFIKILLTQGNLKTAHFEWSRAYGGAQMLPIPYAGPNASLGSFTCDDTRTLQEGIINIDSFGGEDFVYGYNNMVLAGACGNQYYPLGNTNWNILDTAQGDFVPIFTNTTIECTYRPQDGVFIQPKLLPAGVNLNYIFNLSTLGTWANGYNPGVQGGAPAAAQNINVSLNPDSIGDGITTGFSYSIVKAQYYERQYTITQTGLKAYQSLIMRQPLYYSCMTSNTLLYPVSQTQASVQLTNVFSGRLPNIIVIGLLNQNPNGNNIVGTGNIYPLGTYSPLQTLSSHYIYNPVTSTQVTTTADCISAIQLTVNGRTYPHLWSSNMLPNQTQDLSQWYEQYRQCALITALNGRSDGQSNLNFDPKYKYDNPILSKAEFSTGSTFCCFNIRRNGTVLNCSGDKEVGGIDLLVNINGSLHPGAQLMIVGLNTDSLMTITDGGSTTSFVF